MSNMNKFTRLSTKVALLKLDIAFLKKCKIQKIIPSFIKIKCPIKNAVTEKVIDIAQKNWLNFELKEKYAHLAKTELELYNLHCLLANEIYGRPIKSSFECAWYDFLRTTTVEINALVKQKKEKQEKKFNSLLQNKPEQIKNYTDPMPVNNAVVNISNVLLSTDELNLLNKGLNYSIAPTRTPVNDVIVDIETILKFRSFIAKNEIRKKAEDVIKEEEEQPHNTEKQKQKQYEREAKVLKQLKEKDVYIMKADKGNKIVVMDKSEYDRRVWNLIAENGYKEIKSSPLNKMKTAANNVRKEISRVFGERYKWRLIVSDPEVPKLYCLPKIHKQGDKMRQIVALLTAPCTKIAKWLVNELKQYPNFDSCAVKNSIEFAKLIQNLSIKEDEILVSFDVEALFPSIPIEEALTALRIHLMNLNISNEKINIYLAAAKMCMDTNYFEFRKRFFKIESGTSMGNPLSPLIAEAFMSKFEMDLKSAGRLPTVWHRYVDDVFAIVKRSDLNNILNTLNSQYTEINFTCETEREGKLTFLDLELQRKEDKIDIAIHHKATSTMRYITSDSHTPIQHKLAAFQSLAHRLVSLPLSLENYIQEYNYIVQAAKINGYSERIINNIIKKHSQKHQKTQLSSFFTQNRTTDKTEDSIKKVSVTFAPTLTNKLKTTFKQNNMQIVYSNPFKLKNQLISTKDKKENLDKPGIYEIKCNICHRKYYGQTKRSVKQRFAEHEKYIHNNEPRRSAFALHAVTEKHIPVSIDDVRLLKCVNDDRKLDAYESMYIYKDDNALNADKGNIESDLFKFCCV